MEDQDLDDEDKFKFDGHVATIFLIDASVPMFQMPSPVDDEDGEEVYDCPFVLALRCVHSTLLSKIIASQHDSIAVVLFGTKKKDVNDKYGTFASTFVLQDLQKPDGVNIKELEKMFEKNDKTTAEFESLACNPQTFSLADSLWLCSSVFSKHKSKNDSKQVFLFTNTDEPHSKYSDQHKQAERRVGDLLDNRVSVYLFPIGEQFSAEKIYQELFSENLDNILSGSSNLEELFSKTCRKCQKKRVLANLYFNLSPTLKFGVQLYNLTRPAPEPKRVKMDDRTNEVVKAVTTKFNAETAESLLPSELTKCITVSNRKIQMDKNDMASLKTKFPLGFTLLGFKPIDKLKLHLHLSPASFIYPNDDLVKGSRLIFAALLDRCKTRGYAPVCSFKATAITKPRIVALLPELNMKDDSHGTTLSGFHVIYLPFRNDIRKLEYKELVGSTVHDNTQSIPEIWRASQNQVDAATAIIQKLTMKTGYSPELFANPVLHTKWKILEGLALQRGVVETVEDSIMPDFENIDRRLDKRATIFNDLVFPIDYQSKLTQPSVLKFNSLENDDKIESAARNGQLHKTTVEQLKHYLSCQGIRGFTGCKKADLMEKVKIHLNLK